MLREPFRRLLPLAAALLLLLSACAPSGNTPARETEPLTWGTFGNYSRHKPFLELLGRTYPEIDLEFLSYTGGNATGYSWAQMRADDIPDIFITSQILDEELAGERLVDLSGYDFVNGFSTAILDQVAIDGGVYLLPVNNTMYGIYYNKTLMEEKGWELPANLAELEALCAQIRAEGMIPGVVGTMLTGDPFSAVFNLAKTGWLTTPEGIGWERDFLSGEAAAAGMWEDTMDLVQRYIDAGMFTTDPEDRMDIELIQDYLGGRKAVFCTVVQPVSFTVFSDTGDELGMMPYIGEDGSKNVYMYSPFCYFGISRRLTEPGNEKKLEDAVKLLSLLFSPEGQSAFITAQTPCVMSVLDSAGAPEDSLIGDAQAALRAGRAFPMTYAGWEGVLADMGQIYKEWLRGENGVDGARSIARMDALQQNFLSRSEQLCFGESTADFSLEETAELVGGALGSAAGTDAAMIALGGFHSGVELPAGISGKLYAGGINTEIISSISPNYDGEYAVLTMTGAEARTLAQAGFAFAENAEPFPYVLVVRGGGELEDGETCRVAFLMNSYTEEIGGIYSAAVEKGSIRTFLREWIEAQGTVFPGGNPWQ